MGLTWSIKCVDAFHLELFHFHLQIRNYNTMAEPKSTGNFCDGPFVGMEYKTPTHSGITDEYGNISFWASEVVTLFIGKLKIRSAVGATSLILASLGGGSGKDLFRPATINRGRRLLSISRSATSRSGSWSTVKIACIDWAFSKDSKLASKSMPSACSLIISQMVSLMITSLQKSRSVRNHLRRSIRGIKALRDVRIATRDGSWLGADTF